MAEQIICTLEHGQVKGGTELLLSDVSMTISKRQRIGIISEDVSADMLLRVLAGVESMDAGSLQYPLWSGLKPRQVHDMMQFVPDDIVCYTRMKVWQFLVGIAWSAANPRDAEQEAIRLCREFGIKLQENLLDMTFEHNRLVAMIQALMLQPQLVFLECPYDMLGKPVYHKLVDELIEKNRSGLSVVVSARQFANIVLPCDEYYFIKDGSVAARYRSEELPQPAKVVTLWGGTVAPLCSDKMTILYEEEGHVRFLYQEADVKALTQLLSKTGCWNFSIRDVQMEEQIFDNYDKWRV